MPQSETPISKTFDVTVTSEVPFLTGIQRLVRDAADNLPASWRLIRFDTRSRTFRYVEKIPELVYRDSNTFGGKVRAMIRDLVLALVHKFWIPHGISGGKFVRRWARKIFLRFLAEVYLSDNPSWRKGEVWLPRQNDKYLSMEVLTNLEHRNAVRDLQAEGVCTSFYVHDLIPLTHPALFSRSSLSFVRADFLDYTDIVLNSSEIIANSATTLQEFSNLEDLLTPGLQKIRRVVYPAFERKEGHTTRDFNRTPISQENPLRLLGVGALDERKNFQVVLRAYLILLSMDVHVNLMLVSGTGRRIEPTVATLLARMTQDQRDSITLVYGTSDDQLAKLYEESDVVVIPSRAEGFGLPIFEATSRGIPVVASELPVFREVCEKLPVLFANAEDPVEWAQQILRAADSGRPQHSRIPKDLPFPESVRDFTTLLCQ